MIIPHRKIKNRKHVLRILLPLLFVTLVVAVGRNFIFPEKPRNDALTRIKERGYLIALTDKNSLNYFINRGTPMGFQLELLESFADYLEVPLKIITANNVSQLYYYLDYNAGDLIALNLQVTREGARLVKYAQPMGETRMVLVQRIPVDSKKKGNRYIRNLKDFSGDTVYYRSNPFVKPVLRRFINSTGKRVFMQEEKERNTLELIRMVAEKKINYTICDENLAMVAKRYYRNIDAGFVVSGFYHFAWSTAKSSDSLLVNINDWLADMKKQELKRIYLSYYDNANVLRYFQGEYCSFYSKKLSPYDGAIKNSSRLINWDWRLLASLVYEESNFRAGLTSSRSAKGLMQLMPGTANKFGMDSISAPARQIAAGAKYIRWLDTQLSDSISDPRERIYFILASYNVGLGKVMRAREKARKYGLDPDKWNGSVDYYLTRISRKKPMVDSDTIDDNSMYGMAGGFVDNIMARYYHYRNIIPNQ